MQISEIKVRRKQLGWIQSDLARRAGVSKTTIALLECGANKNPNIETLRKIETALATASAQQRLGSGKQKAKRGARKVA